MINLAPIVPVYEEVIPENIEVTENVALLSKLDQ